MKTYCNVIRFHLALIIVFFSLNIKNTLCDTKNTSLFINNQDLVIDLDKNKKIEQDDLKGYLNYYIKNSINSLSSENNLILKNLKIEEQLANFAESTPYKIFRQIQGSKTTKNSDRVFFITKNKSTNKNNQEYNLIDINKKWSALPGLWFSNNSLVSIGKAKSGITKDDLENLLTNFDYYKIFKSQSNNQDHFSWLAILTDKNGNNQSYNKKSKFSLKLSNSDKGKKDNYTLNSRIAVPATLSESNTIAKELNKILEKINNPLNIDKVDAELITSTLLNQNINNSLNKETSSALLPPNLGSLSNNSCANGQKFCGGKCCNNCENDRSGNNVECNDQCSKNSECGEGEKCCKGQCCKGSCGSNGGCVENCGNSGPCPEGQACCNNACCKDGNCDNTQNPPVCNECSKNSDCEGGEKCCGGQCCQNCKSKNENGEPIDPHVCIDCDSDAECSKGEKCCNNACNKVEDSKQCPECNKDQDCPEGKSCIDDECKDCGGTDVEYFDVPEDTIKAALYRNNAIYRELVEIFGYNSRSREPIAILNRTVTKGFPVELPPKAMKMYIDLGLLHGREKIWFPVLADSATSVDMSWGDVETKSGGTRRYERGHPVVVEVEPSITSQHSYSIWHTSKYSIEQDDLYWGKEVKRRDDYPWLYPPHKRVIWLPLYVYYAEFVEGKRVWFVPIVTKDYWVESNENIHTWRYVAASVECSTISAQAVVDNISSELVSNFMNSPEKTLREISTNTWKFSEGLIPFWGSYAYYRDTKDTFGSLVLFAGDLTLVGGLVADGIKSIRLARTLHTTSLTLDACTISMEGYKICQGKGTALDAGITAASTMQMFLAIVVLKNPGITHEILSKLNNKKKKVKLEQTCEKPNIVEKKKCDDKTNSKCPKIKKPITQLEINLKKDSNNQLDFVELDSLIATLPPNTELIPGVSTQNLKLLIQRVADFRYKDGKKPAIGATIGGSRIRGDYTPDSDLDLAFQFTEKIRNGNVGSQISRWKVFLSEYEAKPITGLPQLETFPIVTSRDNPGGPHGWFMAQGTRHPNDPKKPGQPFCPSGYITFWFK